MKDGKHYLSCLRLKSFCFVKKSKRRRRKKKIMRRRIPLKKRRSLNDVHRGLNRKGKHSLKKVNSVKESGGILLKPKDRYDIWCRSKGFALLFRLRDLTSYVIAVHIQFVHYSGKCSV